MPMRIRTVLARRASACRAAAGTMALVAALAGCGGRAASDVSPSLGSKVPSPSASASLGGLPVEVIAGSSGPFEAPVSGPSGPTGFAGDGGPATKAEFAYMVGVDVDAAGNVYVVDQGNNRIRRISPAGIIETIAGSGSTSGFAGDGGPATRAQLSEPEDVALDGAGNLYIADTGNNRLRKVDAKGIISTIAGTGLPASTGDGAAAIKAAISAPDSVAVGKDGTVYLSEQARIRDIRPDGIIQTIAGNGTPFVEQPPFTADSISGAGGPAVKARFNDASDMRIGPDGNLYFADFLDCRILMIDRAGIIHVVAGRGCEDFEGTTGSDGGSAVKATLARPADLAFDPSGRLYILEHFGVVRVVDKDGTINSIHMAWRYEEALGMAIHGGDLYITDRDHMALLRIHLE
jgi:hypothetical protein